MVVIDDNIDDGLPIAASFWKEGINVKYYTGDSDFLPAKALSGIRLLVLDMVLGVTSVEPKDVFGKLFEVLNQLIATNNGPYLIVVWTTHPSLSREFQDLMNFYINGGEPSNNQKNMLKNLKIPKPVSVCRLKKKDFLESISLDDMEGVEEINNIVIKEILSEVISKERFKIDEFLSKIDTEFSKVGSFNILFDWERRIEKCTISTIDMINQLAYESSSNDHFPNKRFRRFDSRWKISTNSILAAIARETGVRKERNLDEIIRSINRGLIPLVLDQMEQLLYPSFDNLHEVTKKVKKVSTYKKRERLFRNAFAGKLNGLLQYDIARDKRFSPGNVYLYDDIEKILTDLSKSDDRLSISKMIIENSLDLEKLETYGKKEEIQTFFMEFSPVCDFLQGKMKSCRLIGGLIIPFLDKEYLLWKTKYLEIFGPICHPKIKYLKEDSLLVFNSHFIFGTQVSSLKETDPIFRVRNQLLASLQGWIAGHASRQGVLKISAG